MADEDRRQDVCKGVLLKSKAPIAFNKSKCIICQVTKASTKLTSSDRGQKRVREAAEVRQDEVFKRLKLLNETDKVFYHMDNNCYKSYTLQKSLDVISNNANSVCPDSPSSDLADAGTSYADVRSIRSTSSSRSQPSSKLSSDDLPCIVCGHVRTTEGHEKIKKKFRICEEQRANKFLAAASSFQDNVFNRIADIDSEERIFAADLFSHGKCMNAYILKYQRSLLKPEKYQEPIISKKFELFRQVNEVIEPLLEGYCFTLSEIRDLMKNLDSNIDIYNNEVKIYLVRTYQDKIRFCPSNRKNEPLLVFSATLDPKELATKIRSHDAVKEAGNILRESMQSIDFKLDDKFCDATELRQSWENTRIPDVLLNFFSTLFNISKSHLLQVQALHPGNIDDDDIDMVDDTHAENSSRTKHQAMQLSCLFQMMYYKLHNGSKKTPLHMMTAHSIYDRCKSKELITSMNRIGVSVSYPEVIRCRNLLATYAVQSSELNSTPIPSHFNSTGFTTGALDNFDFEDGSSLSGTFSTHHTAMVLFQDCSGETAVGKPNVSSTNINKKSCRLKSELPCQSVGYHAKPVDSPCLPKTFQVAEDAGLQLSDKALCMAKDTEFLITLTRSGLPETENIMLPPWGGFHALISKNTVPMKRIAFLPVIPSPVTNYATVYSALKNFDNVRTQLNQPVFLVFCDEGVFHTVAEIFLNNPEEFKNIYPMMGMFHFAKVALRCTGRYLTGSGVDDALIETEVFGVNTVKTVLNGKHYVRSLQGMLIVSEVIESMKWKAFWIKNKYEDHQEIIKRITELREALQAKDESRSQLIFTLVMEACGNLNQKFEEFDSECCEKSEICKYLRVFLRLVCLVKSLVTADHEGNWELHVQTVEKLINVFQVFNCIHYQRYGSWYLERIKKLEMDNLFLYRKFIQGHFAVRDREGKFNAVSPDMKLEQTIQRSQKSSKGIIGQTRKSEYIAEWQLVYHEILGISNVFREMTNAKVMDHTEISHHELTGRKGEVFNTNIKKLLDFMLEKENPYDVNCQVPLHNLMTKQCVEEDVKTRLLNVFEDGSKLYKQFRTERFISKTKKLNDKISKAKLPCFSDLTTSNRKLTPTGITSKQLATAQRAMDIARERGESLKDVLAYDLFPTNPLFEGDAATKPDKHTLITELEKTLLLDDYVFEPMSELKTAVLVDFMSQVRMKKMLPEKTFGQVVISVLRNAQAICSMQEMHIIFDSYLEFSLKECERLRRASDIGIFELANICPDTPIPVQMDKFWTSSKNKTNLQLLTRQLIPEHSNQTGIPIMASGMVVNDKVVTAALYSNDENIEVQEISGFIEEADHRIVPHVNWTIEHGAKRVVILSNDTDVVVLLLRYMSVFHTKGAEEIWVRFGIGKNRRFIPLHRLLIKLGPEACSVLVKCHILSGDDILSKVGTKLAAIRAEPILFLEQFGETDSISEEVIQNVEKYLVRVWSRNADVNTFDELKFIIYTQCKKSLAELPPTSSSIKGHIQRAFLVIRESLTLLSHGNSTLSPLDYCWEEVDGHLIPDKCLRPLPEELLTLCGCKTCKTKACKCKKVGLPCSIFCKSQKNCQNAL